MRTISLDLSDELHERAQELAKENKVSIDSLVATALTFGIFIPHTEKYIAERNQKKQAS
jgi:predicted transcriptional regulator